MLDPKIVENNIVRWVAIISFLMIVFFGIHIAANIYSGKLTEKLMASAESMDNSIRSQIDNTTDAYQALKIGTSLLKSQKTDLALAAFQKATSLDPNYRDAWVGRGYAELQANQPQAALESLKKAENLDPTNPRTYELLAIAYQQTGDEEQAKKAQEKFLYLNKTKSQ